MAVAKVGSAGASAGAINYVLSENKELSKKPEILAGSFGSIEDIKKEFEIYNKLNRKVKNQATHISISFQTNEQVDSKKKVELAEKLLEKLDFTNVPYLVVEHHDKEYEHFHIVAGRIRQDGSTVNEWNIAERTISATKELEKDLGLKQLEYNKSNDRQIKRNEYKRMERTGELSIMAEAKFVIDETLNKQPKVKDFVEVLENSGFEVRPNVSESTGKMNGFSYKKDAFTFKSSAIAKNYSWNNLQKNGLDYDQKRDTEFLINLKKEESQLTEKEKNNELTRQYDQEIGFPRVEQKITDDQINSSSRANEQSSVVGRNLQQRSSNEISSKKSDRFNESEQCAEIENLTIGKNIERTGGIEGEKRISNQRNESDGINSDELKERNSEIEQATDNSTVEIPNTSESDRRRSQFTFSNTNFGNEGFLYTEDRTNRSRLEEKDRTDGDETINENTGTFEQQGTSSNRFYETIQSRKGYSGLSEESNEFEYRNFETNEIVNTEETDSSNLGNFGGYYGFNEFYAKTFLENSSVDYSSNDAELLHELMIQETLLTFWSSIEKQNLSISPEAIDLYESKLEIMAFATPSKELIKTVENFNQKQPIEKQISIEDKTNLEIHVEWLQTDTDNRVQEIANHLENEVKKETDLTEQNNSSETLQNKTIENERGYDLEM